MSTYTQQHLERTVSEIMERLNIQECPGELELYGDARVYLRGKIIDWFRAGQVAMRNKYEGRLRAGSHDIERGPVGLDDPL